MNSKSTVNILFWWETERPQVLFRVVALTYRQQDFFCVFKKFQLPSKRPSVLRMDTKTVSALPNPIEWN